MQLFEKRKSMSFGQMIENAKDNKQIKNPKKKNINFELLGVNSFGMQGNFAFSEEFLGYVRNNWRMMYDKTHKLWVFTPLDCYHAVYQHVKERFEGRGADVIPIPPFAFTLIESTVPFGEKTATKIRHHYDYANDSYLKPRITALPTKLFRQLYNF